MSKETINVKELRPMLQSFNEKLGRYINDDQRFRLGKVLTLIDASISDSEQRKAMKDIVNEFWWNDVRNAPVEAGNMVNPHSEIRGLTEALGFELYEEMATTAGGPLLASPDKDWAQGYAKEQYIEVARKAAE